MPPQLPSELRRRILVAWGEEARDWLAAAPALAARRAQLWHLALEQTIVEGFDSWVLSCRGRDGRPRVLKLVPDGPAARAQIATLRSWERLGATRVVRLLQANPVEGALLLERIEPGRSGTELPADAAAQEAAAILTDLHRPLLGAQPHVPPLAARVASALDYVRARLGRTALTRSGEQHAAELLDSAPEAVLLHADFSLRNMLDAGGRGFVAIDPTGALGERAYDVANWAAEHPPQSIEERACCLARLVGVDERRALAWTHLLALHGAAQALAWNPALARQLERYAGFAASTRRRRA
jgi:streptomycin 6-kinase